MDRLVVGISGASGAIFGIRILEILKGLGSYETHLVISKAAEQTIGIETEWNIGDVRSLADIVYGVEEIGAPIASGSFATRGMIIAPCSIKTLSSIANSYANDLLVRAADVQLKEGRPVLLMVRETPFHPGHIRLMSIASASGAIIMPPIPSFYGSSQTLNGMIDGIAGRALSRLGIENEYFTQWLGPDGIDG